MGTLAISPPTCGPAAVMAATSASSARTRLALRRTGRQPGSGQGPARRPSHIPLLALPLCTEPHAALPPAHASPAARPAHLRGCVQPSVAAVATDDDTAARGPPRACSPASRRLRRAAGVRGGGGAGQTVRGRGRARTLPAPVAAACRPRAAAGHEGLSRRGHTGRNLQGSTCKHHITSQHITSHHITSHHITSHHITSHHITSHHITSHHITSPEGLERGVRVVACQRHELEAWPRRREGAGQGEEGGERHGLC
jgi:hypothetical protein